ncbi:MAG: site-2 protease family protein [Nostoc sp.]|uniref:site-2 protease family protein n=1 Tax=Nostoc sp. TaxID=1180 RepID=UPI002FF7C76B
MQTHQDHLKQLTTSKTACGLSPESFAQALQIQMRGYVSNLAKTGKISPIKGTELFEIHWLTVLRSLNPMTQGNKKAANIIKQRRQQAKTDSSILQEIPIELEVEGFKQMEYTQTGLVGKKFRTWLLFGSLGLFIASYTSFLSPQSVVIFIAVLFFHEGGHLLAMKLFGYRDTSVLFVPFLGALATARKDDATLTQKFWISLAGPLPGLILGIGLAVLAPFGSGYPDWVQKTSWTLIFLNLFNLLPVYPLDGGQIADLLLFSRFPYIGVLFKVFGVIILFKVFGVIILGFLGKDRPMLLLFAMLIAMGIPNSFRSAKINQKFQKELQLNPPIDRDNILHFIFKYLKQLGYGNLPFSKRYALVKGLIQQQHESRSKWKTRVFLLVIYCVTLLGGMVGALQAMAPSWVRLLTYYSQNSQQRIEQIRKNRQQQIELATATLRKNPNDVDAYIKRSRARMGLRDYKGALADYDQIVRLKPDDIEYRRTRASFRNRLKDYKGAIQDYNEILHLNPKNVSDIYYQRAQVLNHLEDYKRSLITTKLLN